jgi:hypothetical protein
MLAINTIIRLNNVSYKIIYTGQDKTVSLYIIDLDRLTNIYYSKILHEKSNLINNIFDKNDLEDLITKILKKSPIKNNFIMPIKQIDINELRSRHQHIYKQIKKYHISELVMDNISSILLALSLYIIISVLVFIFTLITTYNILTLSYPTLLFFLTLFIWCKLNNIYNITKVDIIKKN